MLLKRCRYESRATITVQCVTLHCSDQIVIIIRPSFVSQAPAAVAPVVIPTPVVKAISLGGEVHIASYEVGLFVWHHHSTSVIQYCTRNEPHQGVDLSEARPTRRPTFGLAQYILA